MASSDSQVFYDAFLSRAYELCPSLKKHQLVFDRKVISPFVLDLRHDDLKEMEKIVELAFHFEKPPQGPYSLLMGYDFHITPEGPRLIEINTNAAGALVVDLLAEMAGIKRTRSFAEMFLNDLLMDYQALFPGRQPQGFAVVDEKLEDQGFLAEMFMYRDIVEDHFKIPSFVLEPKDFSWRSDRGLFYGEQRIDCIYFRSTDFELKSSSHHALKSAYESQSILLSPNPREYLRLANKERLFDLAETLGIERPFRVTEDLWERRKSLVFKPMKKFGGRGVYRGSGLTRSKFAEICTDQNYIAQTYYPPQIIEAGGLSLKSDIRCFVYRDQIELVGARLYQGQVTSFGVEGGGIAAVRLV